MRPAFILSVLVMGALRGQDVGPVVEDIFGRNVNDYGLTLVDWEGFMANPAIKVFLLPPSGIAFPARAVLTSPEQRLAFDLPSSVGVIGPSKTITFADAAARVPVYISIAPDRDTVDNDYPLSIQLTAADGATASLTINVHVVDQDKTDPGPFKVTVDFSKDKTGFFADAQKRAIIQQAADDWAYFIDDMALDAVPANAEMTFIWNPDGFVGGTYVRNAAPYTGYLLYAYGIHSSALRSGGEPSLAGGLQTSVGKPLMLKRSGGHEVETAGNYNSLGWLLNTKDSDWWVSGNFGNELNDLFSIAHHEIGHALVFNPAQPRFMTFKAKGFIEDAALLAYHGAYPHIDPSDHLDGEIDDASRKGAFGYEYFGDMPRRRWMITKLDLLAAQAVGYKLRQTSALVPLSISTTALADGSVSQPYSASLSAVGGIPFYNWTMDSGALPDGLSLDPFSGVISGIPTAGGAYPFTIRVYDYVEGSPGVAIPLSITIAE